MKASTEPVTAVVGVIVTLRESVERAAVTGMPVINSESTRALAVFGSSWPALVVLARVPSEMAGPQRRMAVFAPLPVV